MFITKIVEPKVGFCSLYLHKMKNTIYNIEANSLSGKKVSLSEWKDRVILIVNTASKCGFTGQYEGLEKLYEKHKDKGLVILGFPCNQFNNQEPGDAESIQKGCMLNYGVTFPMFEKIDVNGTDAHPLFVYLKNELPGFINNAIKWNFTKFLIDKNGVPFKRYGSITKPESIENDIVELLKK